LLTVLFVDGSLNNSNPMNFRPCTASGRLEEHHCIIRDWCALL
jgi:hypothetical protein